jgi:clan AA aspartic protease (TIGR02281 family)
LRIYPTQPTIPEPARFRTPSINHDADLLLDTGATYLTLNPLLAQELGLDGSRTAASRDLITPAGLVRAPVVNVPSIEVLGQQATNITAVILDLPPELTVRGLLGLSFLNRFDTDIHFLKGVLALHR